MIAREVAALADRFNADPVLPWQNAGALAVYGRPSAGRLLDVPLGIISLSKISLLGEAHVWDFRQYPSFLLGAYY